MESSFVVKMLLNAGFGAIIGALTNYWALTALFRPYEDLRIGGKTVWRAGVIPRNRRALGEKIGELVAGELLNDQVVTDILLSEDARRFIEEGLVDGVVRTLQEDRRTVRDYVGDWFDEKTADHIANRVPDRLGTMLAAFLQRKGTIDFVADRLEKLTEQFLQTKVSAVTESRNYMKIRYGLREVLRGAVETGIVRDHLLSVVHTRLAEWEGLTTPLRQLLPKRIQTAVRRAILAEGPQLADQLVAYVRSPEVKSRLRAGIDDVIESFTAVARWFARRYHRKHDIAEKIVYYVTTFLEDAQNQKELVQKIVEIVDGFLDKSPGDVIRWVGRDNLEAVGEYAIDQALSMRNLDVMMDRTDRYLRDAGGVTWAEMAVTKQLLPSDLRSSWRGVVEALLTSRGAEQLLLDSVGGAARWVLDARPSEYAAKLTVRNVSRIKRWAVRLYEQAALTHGVRAFKQMPVANHVSRYMDDLDMADLEKLLRRVLGKELWHLVWLGALFGAIVGGATWRLLALF